MNGYDSYSSNGYPLSVSAISNQLSSKGWLAYKLTQDPGWATSDSISDRSEELFNQRQYMIKAGFEKPNWAEF